jgi:glycerophosphoryl diester phosphodiesterase
MGMKRILLYILLISLVNCGKKTELPIVDVFGHAGISLHKEKSIYPSNSFESIEYAIDILDTDGVEIDVQMTKDSILVVYHDPFIEESAGFIGCISQYNYEEVKELELENTKYKIVKLNDVLLFVQSRNKQVYLDIKDYDYCNGTHISEYAFQHALNQSLNGITETFKTKIILGMLNLNFLEGIDYPLKCYENSNVILVIENAKANNIKAVLFHVDLINETERVLLTASGLYWGVFGIKYKWSIESAIDLNPNFVITDNIAFTKQISN